MSITLTDKQQYIFDDLIDKINNFPGRIEAVIVGNAGTGKSTLVSKIIESIYQGYNIAVTSPTHKANSVLRKMLLNTGVTKEDALISTIHSFLGLKLQYEKNRQVLKHDPRSPNSTAMVDVLFVDECSMISEEMYTHILNQIHRVRRAVVFIGDDCQLPPVETEGTSGETKLSPTFNIRLQYKLDEVLRQALDNPIINIATQIRECIGTGRDPMTILNAIDGSETIMPIDDEMTFLDVYKEYINESKGSAKKIYDFVQENKIIAYTNYRVNFANMYIRNEVFSEHTEEEFIPGEPIVFETTTENCPYTVQEIIQCPEIRKESFLGIDCWQFKLPNGNYLLGVGPYSRMKLDAYLEDLVLKIEKKEENPLTKKPYMWQDYYVIKNKINVINYPYATTAHKSQGSTFNNIWFDTDFIERIPNNDTKCRILYTALTRPRYTVMLRKNGRF
ncbi:DNA helicase Dda [Cronobacter phage vB_CsaM_GAP32]|uniref:DNA helicase Dda n=1 Tax=Cronobacter phage vB_CsaM_GAP32 TaxID=1141136 RepID=K4F9M2_9CAUD|nr:DNA helicase Dda [Cronobacter phage vB_CsaM_GAP32]AFC21760.1 DNA helicase Dda [Cronobacter phage vB_CsaM_GAP32]